jgi:translocation and assembly module TamA
MQVAAGLGVRYLSPAGPIRFDLGVPLNPRDTDDPLQIYISIGQAW